MPSRKSSALSIRLMLTGALAAAALVVLASPAAAASCQFDPNTRHVTASISDTDNELRLAVDGVNLEANGFLCAALTSIETVNVNMAARSVGGAVFDLTGGAFGPGFTNEGDGSSEIEFTITGLAPDVGQIRIDGSTGNDNITFGRIGGGQINLNANADGATPDVDATFASFPLSLTANGNAGNDSISGAGVLDTTTPYTQPLTINGGPGSNTLTGGTGSDRIAIRTESVSTGAETVAGGGGSFDALVISTDSASLKSSFSLDGVANDGVGCPGTSCEGDNISGFTFIGGSAAAETLIGTHQTDVFNGGGGNDVLRGLDGADTLDCAGGKTFGGSSIDFISTHAGCKVVSGGSGRDSVRFDSATQGVTVTLDNVADDGMPTALMNVRADNEIISGSNFGDTIVGSAKRNLLDGGSGPDNLSGGGGSDRLEGGPSTDTLSGGANDDRLFGENGDDSLNGNDGVDVCKQGQGTGSVVNCES